MNWQQLIQSFGYPIVALGIGLESMGIPVPGETILIIGAAIAATGQLNIGAVILSAALGAIIGDNIAYNLGKRQGRSILSRFRHFDQTKLAKSEAFFAKHGQRTVFFARFIPLLRMVAAYLAGINKMPARVFFFYNMLGGVAWAIGAGAIGYFFGENLHLIDIWMRRVGTVSAIFILLIIALLWGNHHWRHNEKSFWLSRTGYWFLAFQKMRLWIVQYGKKGFAIYVGMLVSGGWLFGALLDDWIDREPELCARDHFLTTWLKGGISETPVWLEWISFLGDGRVLVAIGLGIAIWQLVNGQKLLVKLSLLNVLSALLIGWLFQISLQRPLPSDHELIWQLTKYSFPHLSSFMAVAVYAWFAYVWGRSKAWSARIHAGTIAISLILSTAIFGLFTGQAHLTDVIAGLTLGGLWFGLFWGIIYWLSLANRVQGTILKG